MRKPIYIARAENETPSELERILPQFVLAMPGGFCPSAGYEIFPSQEMKKVCARQLCDLVGFTLLIDHQWKRDASFRAKGSGVLAVAKSNRCQGGAFLPECHFTFAQLRDVFSAEYSAIVTQKN